MKTQFFLLLSFFLDSTSNKGVFLNCSGVPKGLPGQCGQSARKPWPLRSVLEACSGAVGADLPAKAGSDYSDGICFP